MSIFPAYASSNLTGENKDGHLTWLQNTSCPIEVGISDSQNLPKDSSPTEDDNHGNSPNPTANCISEQEHKPQTGRIHKKSKNRSKSKSKKKHRHTSLSPSRSKARPLETSSKHSHRKSKKHSHKKRKEESFSSYSSSRSRSPSPKRHLLAKKRHKSRSRSLSLKRNALSTRDKKHSKYSHKDKKRCRQRSSESRSNSDSNECRSRSRNPKHSHSKRHKSGVRHSKRDSRSKSNQQKKKKNPALQQQSKEAEEFELFKTTILSLVERSKSIFLDGLAGTVKPEESFFLCSYGDQSNAALPFTQATLVPRYAKRKGTLGIDYHSDRKGKKAKRYFSKSSKLLLIQPGRPVGQIEDKTSQVSTTNYISLNPAWYEEAKILQNVKLNSYAGGFSVLEAVTGPPMGMDINTHTEETENAEVKDPEENFWRSKVKQYNETLKKMPSNIDLWLEFVRIHDKAYIYLFQGESADEGFTKKKDRMKRSQELAERKISILDSAIKKNMKSLQLYFERLKIGENIWESKYLKKEWDKLVFSFSDSLVAWCHSLSFYQTFFSLFTLQTTVESFAKCSGTLVQMQEGTFLTSKAPEKIGYHLIQLAKQVAFTWYQGGYLERSIALFQALIELNLHCPNHLKRNAVDQQTRLALFEAFWDSRAPRFGEKDSIGWAKYMETKKPVVYPEVILGGLQDKEDDMLAAGGSNSQLWLSLESYREACHWLAWQQDPEDCEDPERIVHCDDLKEHIFTLESDQDLVTLLIEFISFLGVPLSDGSIPSKLDLDLLCRTEDLIAKHFEPLRVESLDARWLKGMENSLDDDPDDLFRFPIIGPSLQKRSCHEYFSFVSDVIKQAMDLVNCSFKPLFGVLYIRLMKLRCSAERKEVGGALSSLSWSRKQIRSLLKMDSFRNDTRLYYEFALFEFSVGAYAEVSKICSMVVASSELNYNALISETDGDISLLKHLLLLVKAEFLMEEKTSDLTHINSILNILSSLVLASKATVSNTTPNSSLVLRSRKRLHEIKEAQFENMFLSERADYKIIFTIIFLAFLHLLTGGFKIACQLIQESINKVSVLHRRASTPEKSREFAEFIAHIYEEYIWLIKTSPMLSRVTSPMAPSTFRTILKEALRFSPTNEVFLQFASEKQNWQDLLKVQHFESDRPVIEFIYKLLPHIKKTINFISSTKIDGSISCVNQMEHILESAVSSSKSKSCPLLWRLYLRLTKVTKPCSVREIAYRALTNCPGVKCLYLDCVRFIPDMMDDIIKLMMEKGIRVRLPLEELSVLLENEEPQDAPNEELKSSNVFDENCDNLNIEDT